MSYLILSYLYFVTLQNVFQLIASGVNTDASTWYCRWTSVVHSHRVRATWRTSYKTNKFSHATLCTAFENHITKLHKLIFTCHNLACKPPWNICLHMTPGHFQTVHLQANSRQTESGQNGGHDRGWSTGHQQLAVIIYTKKFSPLI